MRYSRMFLPTLREVPAEAEVVSHQYLLRAGMIRKLASGVYSYLPLGLRSLRKVEEIVRQEMNRAGAQEVLLPSVQPAELWQETGRWAIMGPELLRFKDRHEREFCYGPTHEEVVTDLVRRDVRSYRDLPFTLYQIQTKFRDEIRPRFGLMRGREFIMKDAYSFDLDPEGAEKSYWVMYEAYKRIFERMGLDFRAVEAETGYIGGSFSHEFMVLADSGEDAILFCTSCDYAANSEKAEIRLETDGERQPQPAGPAPALEPVLTKGKRTIEEVTRFLGVPPSCLVKTLLYRTDRGDVLVLVRGDREANEHKVGKLLGSSGTVALAPPEDVERALGVPAGYVGPVGLSLPVVADQEVRDLRDAVVGANRIDYHLLHFDARRDLREPRYADLRIADTGDPCPRCGAAMEKRRGIEVGHVFMLGTKYSEALHATYLDAEGKERPVCMGCYGIGIGRTLAAAIEQRHDQDGIRFPLPLSPFSVIITSVNPAEEKVRLVSEALYRELCGKGVEVLLDDRDERPGKKFKDADLIGIPLRITVGPKQLQQDRVEIKLRTEREAMVVAVKEASERILEILKDHARAPA
ncbi:MAG: proline--tRNA ligase [bacterium]